MKDPQQHDHATNATPAREERFDEVVSLIHSARQRCMQAVNTQLIELYWQVGAYISRKIENAEWGDAVVSQLAATWRVPSRVCVVSRDRTCSACASSSRPIVTTKLSHRW